MPKKMEKAFSKANKTLEKFEKQINKYSEGPKRLFKELIEFLKKHKKLLITLGIAYIAFEFLFGEEVEDEEEVEEDDE